MPTTAKTKTQSAATWSLDYDGLWVDWVRLAFGSEQFTCYAKEPFGPVGMIWCHCFGAGRQGKKQRCEVLMIFVPEYYRRNGVATRLLSAVFDFGGADIVVTQSGSIDGGEAWLKATGWTLDRRTGMWSITKREFTKRQKT